VVPRRDRRPEVVDVQAEGREVTFPADDVEPVEGVDGPRDLSAAQDAHLELAHLVVGVGLGHLDDGGIEERVPPQ
jgi:hypothetical protein